jgi:mannose-6-phosphate isomerase
MKLVSRLSEKPWGQICVPHAQGPLRSSKIGEVCFEHGSSDPLALMVKYLYTSERLSIQVHPDDEQARSRGFACGKDEMWIVLDAQQGATIGLGLKRETSERELRAAIDGGQIEDLVDWRPVQRGDVIYNSAGTIHAAGAGLVLLEIQQCVDLTYRLYDYGRPRELHLQDGLAVARPMPHDGALDCNLPESGSAILVDGPRFGAAWCDGELPADVRRDSGQYQLAVLEGEAVVGAAVIGAGECGLASSLDGIAIRLGCTAVLCWPTSRQSDVAMARAA